MIQKKLAAKIFKCSPKRVRIFATPEELKNAIRKIDVRALIKQGKIIEIPAKINSRGRLRERNAQKLKGRRKGQGSRKGSSKARQDEKTTWMRTIRLQRKVIKHLRKTSQVNKKKYRELYRKSRGSFFRSKKHLLNYVKGEL